MSNGSNRILDELAKWATDAAGATQGVRKEIEETIRVQAERALNMFDVVKREDFEAVKEIALKARAENEELSKRILALEESVARLSDKIK